MADIERDPAYIEACVLRGHMMRDERIARWVAIAAIVALALTTALVVLAP